LHPRLDARGKRRSQIGPAVGFCLGAQAAFLRLEEPRPELLLRPELAFLPGVLLRDEDEELRPDELVLLEEPRPEEMLRTEALLPELPLRDPELREDVADVRLLELLLLPLACSSSG
jgi:dienelactone hydrolase